jgi:hypothetical protein
MLVETFGNIPQSEQIPFDPPLEPPLPPLDPPPGAAWLTWMSIGLLVGVEE